MNQAEIPLIVDLDGTLIKTDLLLEGLYALLKRNISLIFIIPFWLMRGKACLKYQIATRFDIDAKSLPYNEPFVEYLHKEFHNGRELILATASYKILAQKVANHLGIFSHVLASDKNLNLSAKQKLKVFLAEYGEKGFDYAGNAKPDLHIFPYARNALLVNPGNVTLKKAEKISTVHKVFKDTSNRFLVYLRAIRVYQWLKNLLLFIPLFTSHEWYNGSMVIKGIAGFTAFSLCASGGYLFNDFLDLPSDRNHPRKRNRPIASGDISIISGSVLMIILPLMGLAIALFMNWTFFCILIGYLALTLTYTIYLKSFMLVDVLVLAGLYTIRVIAGGEVMNVFPSFWLLAFSIFIFYSLALVKRCSELVTIDKIGDETARGRDYRVTDLSYLKAMGITSGYLSIIVVALYINSPEVTVLYYKPKVLWLICPLLLHWISRLWLKTGRGEMTDDPIMFALRDRVSQYIAIASAVIIFLAI
ncbi:MAG: UbiA family prenyltransferase [Candidatus Omnitrophica bacterium]|nr:UbiA family prenyltransferase [Candidatus Omnitrophota bacterium]